jgi:hypothetical protein
MSDRHTAIQSIVDSHRNEVELYCPFWKQSSVPAITTI